MNFNKLIINMCNNRNFNKNNKNRKMTLKTLHLIKYMIN